MEITEPILKQGKQVEILWHPIRLISLLCFSVLLLWWTHASFPAGTLFRRVDFKTWISCHEMVLSKLTHYIGKIILAFDLRSIHESFTSLARLCGECDNYLNRVRQKLESKPSPRLRKLFNSVNTAIISLQHKRSVSWVD